MATTTTNPKSNLRLQSVIDTIVCFGWGVYPYVAATRSLQNAMMLVCILSICTASEMIWINKEAYEHNLKRIQIHKLTSLLPVSYVWSTFLLISTPYVCHSDNNRYRAPDWVMIPTTIPLFESSQIDFTQVTIHDVFAFLGAAWVADVIFSYHHKYYLHKYHSSIHKLHHCCKSLSIGNVLTFHPLNAMMELSIMNFPAIFLYGNHNLVLFTIMWTYFHAFANHSVTYGTSHGKVHHGLTAPAYNCYPMVFTDILAEQQAYNDDQLQQQLLEDRDDKKSQ